MINSTFTRLLHKYKNQDKNPNANNCCQKQNTKRHVDHRREFLKNLKIDKIYYMGATYFISF